MIGRTLVVVVALVAALTVSPSAQAADGTNPLAGHRWGVYKGSSELSWEPYKNATGARKKLLAKIALRPKAKWFGDWIADDKIYGKVREYVANATRGNPDVIVPLTVFRMKPWEQDACKRLPTKAERASYKRWITRFARALGRTRTLMVLQPDGPFAHCAPHGSKIPARLVAWSARTFGALPRTTVYLEAGASDWLPVEDAVQLLVDLGVEHTRGFALNTTHYDSPEANIRYGAEIADRLAGARAKGQALRRRHRPERAPVHLPVVGVAPQGPGLRRRRTLPQSQRRPLRHPRHPTHGPRHEAVPRVAARRPPARW